MEVFYNENILQNNQFLNISETQAEPHINLNVNPNKLYTLVFYDPDAISGTYIHWIKTNITNSDIKTGNIIIPYKGPSPPPKTGKHHYIFNLYEQNGENKLGPLEEKVFELNQLENKLGLNKIIYQIQFISEYKSGGKRTRRNKRKRINSKKSIKNRKTKRKY